MPDDGAATRAALRELIEEGRAVGASYDAGRLKRMGRLARGLDEDLLADIEDLRSLSEWPPDKEEARGLVPKVVADAETTWE